MTLGNKFMNETKNYSKDAIVYLYYMSFKLLQKQYLVFLLRI